MLEKIVREITFKFIKVYKKLKDILGTNKTSTNSK